MVDHPAQRPAHDSYGRRIDYLRVSLTDRCNLRCVYCMPALGLPVLPASETISNAELLLVLRAAAAVGLRKIRLTGGEPTLRPGLVALVQALKAIPGIEEVTMTTNALRLRTLAAPLRAAGLDRLNISVDSLDPQRFRTMTRGGNLADVWMGVQAAEVAGFESIKLNVVVVQGLNDDEVVRLAALTIVHPWELRFIEVMPLPGVVDLAAASVVPTTDLMTAVRDHFGPLTPSEQKPGDPARSYRIPGGVGKIGFISAVSEPFCAACNRMRLTADGRLHLCLLRDDEVDLRAALRAGADQAMIEHCIRQAIALKPWGHDLSAGLIPRQRGMSQLGG